VNIPTSTDVPYQRVSYPHGLLHNISSLSKLLIIGLFSVEINNDGPSIRLSVFSSMVNFGGLQAKQKQFQIFRVVQEMRVIIIRIRSHGTLF